MSWFCQETSRSLVFPVQRCKWCRSVWRSRPRTSTQFFAFDKSPSKTMKKQGGVSDRFLMGFFVSFGKTPIATYSYCHHLSDSFPLPDATDLFQVAHRAIPDRLVVDPWRTQWEYNENAMSKCHFWSEYIWIKQCKTWIGLLDCLAERLQVSFLSSLE